MSAAEILKSMKGTPKLDSASYNRWCTHFSDALSIFEVDNYLIVEKTELATRNAKNIPEAHLTVHKQDRNIRIAISQLVPNIAFHLVNSSYTSKQCWDNLRQFYCPNSAEDIDDLLQEFWGLIVEDDIEVDDLVQKLADIRGKINLIDEKSAPAESSMKKRILGHFIKCCGGFYMATVISLRDSSISFQSVYKELHPTPVVALVSNEKGSNPNPTSVHVKTCAHCRSRGHLRESCFLWLDTPDGSRWAAKNPEKAAKTRKLREKLGRRKRYGKSTSSSKKSEGNSAESQPGAWMMEERTLTSYTTTAYDIVLDTGATNHIFNNKTLFTSMSASDKKIFTTSDASIPVSGVGDCHGLITSATRLSI